MQLKVSYSASLAFGRKGDTIMAAFHYDAKVLPVTLAFQCYIATYVIHKCKNVRLQNWEFIQA